MNRRMGTCLGLLAGLAGCAAGNRTQDLAAADSAAIAAVQSRYVAAWLADDTAGVLATLDSTAVLLPPGRTPVQGHRAIRAYWWPQDGSHTRIDSFTLEQTGFIGSGTVAVIQGVSTVRWTYSKDTVQTAQTVRNLSLSVLTRGPDGEWRIARQMWGPGLP